MVGPADPVKFEAALKAHGGEVLGATNPYEVLRFKTRFGVGVIYRNKKGRVTWNEQALQARDHIKKQKGSLAPVKVSGRRTNQATVAGLLRRDGPDCFFCRRPLGDDITVEHLVPVSHGGPNHVSNLFLAHAACNQKAGHKSGPEKVAMMLAMLADQPNSGE